MNARFPLAQQIASFAPSYYDKWRHGGWYVGGVTYPSGASGCVSRNFADRKWRIACDPAPFATAPTYRNRTEAARGEYALTLLLAAGADALTPDQLAIARARAYVWNGTAAELIASFQSTSVPAPAEPVELAETLPEAERDGFRELARYWTGDLAGLRDRQDQEPDQVDEDDQALPWRQLSAGLYEAAGTTDGRPWGYHVADGRTDGKEWAARDAYSTRVVRGLPTADAAKRAAEEMAAGRTPAGLYDIRTGRFARPEDQVAAANRAAARPAGAPLPALPPTRRPAGHGTCDGCDLPRPLHTVAGNALTQCNTCHDIDARTRRPVRTPVRLAAA